MPENRTTNFISNLSYLKRYTYLYGLTGTLGLKPSQNFIKNTY